MAEIAEITISVVKGPERALKRKKGPSRKAWALEKPHALAPKGQQTT